MRGSAAPRRWWSSRRFSGAVWSWSRCSGRRRSIRCRPAPGMRCLRTAASCLSPPERPCSQWPAPTDAVQWGPGASRMVTTTSTRPADRSVGVLLPAGWKEPAWLCGLHRPFACFDCCNWPRRAAFPCARTPLGRGLVSPEVVSWVATAEDRHSAASAGTAEAGALPKGTMVAACFAVMAGQVGIAIPATLNGLFQEYFHPIGSQLTWISDAFLLPVVALELTFGVLGDLFGRKRLLVIGGVLLTVGEALAAAAPNVQLLWVSQAISGLGAGALFPTSLAMVAAATHTPRARARAIAIWAGFLSAGGFIAPVLGGITGSYG